MNIRQKPESLIPQSVTGGPLPGSRKIYHQPLARPDIKVPFREIALDPSSGEAPLRVYDPSGPYTEDGVHDRSFGRAAAPARALGSPRGGFEAYAGRALRPEDNGNVAGDKLVPPCPAITAPLRGKHGAPVTQYEFARAGIITEEMIYVAARENLGRDKMLEGARGAARRRRKFRRVDLPPSSRRNSCATRSRAAAPSFRPTSIIPNSSR